MNNFNYEYILKILISIFLIFIFFNWIKLSQSIHWTRNKMQDILFKNENLQKQIVNLEAEKYLIYNLDTEKIILEKRGSEKTPIASISKIISVATFLKTLEEKNLSLENPKLSYAKSKIQKGLIQSDNEDIEILGQIYAQLFDKNLLTDSQLFLTNLGIENFTFTTLTGLDIENNTDNKKVLIPSNFLSPEDLSKVFKYIYENKKQIFEYTKFDSLKTEDRKEVAINTNQNVEKTFGLIISKTGFTDTAGGNLATVINFAPGETYLIVVLQSTKEGRFTDIKKLISILPNL